MKNFNILCFFGIHDWDGMGEEFDNKWNGGLYKHLMCKRCWKFKLKRKK